MKTNTFNFKGYQIRLTVENNSHSHTYTTLVRRDSKRLAEREAKQRALLDFRGHHLCDDHAPVATVLNVARDDDATDYGRVTETN